MQSISMTCPDDWHLHLRDGAILSAVLPHTVNQFRRAVVMPNLPRPVTSIADALCYRERIIQRIQPGREFQPLMTLYLTDATTPELVKEASKTDCIIGFKLYPAGATTNSSSGVSDPDRIYYLYEALEKSRDALFGKAKKYKEKNAVAISVQKHSGQSFEFVLDKSEPAYMRFEMLMGDILGKGSELPHSIHHKLKQMEPLIQSLLQEKDDDGNPTERGIEPLFENFFNEEWGL